ncbi:unnamed protein product [Prorocentrum cordatum]|uniref:Phospholipase B-like n=1 Tax=Prorocentrum cordatum TaxID=2364126 RepID=A0ABN9XP11_9DINO|nr:unnamed protein product [Polarella glacialis]
MTQWMSLRHGWQCSDLHIRCLIVVPGYPRQPANGSQSVLNPPSSSFSLRQNCTRDPGRPAVRRKSHDAMKDRQLFCHRPGGLPAFVVSFRAANFTRDMWADLMGTAWQQRDTSMAPTWHQHGIARD